MAITSRLFLLIISACCFAETTHAQIGAAIDRYEKEEKACLDSSRSKFGCVVLFRKRMDSLLVLLNDAAANRAWVEKDHKEWLAKQKEFDQKTDTQYRLEIAEKDFGETAATMALSEKADFVRDRVRELAKKAKKP